MMYGDDWEGEIDREKWEWERRKGILEIVAVRKVKSRMEKSPNEKE